MYIVQNLSSLHVIFLPPSTFNQIRGVLWAFTANASLHTGHLASPPIFPGFFSFAFTFLENAAKRARFDSRRLSKFQQESEWPP